MRLAVVAVPILIGFVGYFFVSAEQGSIAEPALEAVRTNVTASASRSDAPVTILFTGDMMFDRAVAVKVAQNGYGSIVASTSPIFAGADTIVPNLEGTITTDPSVAIVNHADLRFTFNPAVAPWLYSIGVRAVSLSNNHSDDFGADGLAETKQYLASAGVAYFGSPSNESDLSTTLTVNGKKICFVGYEGFINTDPAPVAAEIARLRPSCDFLIATMHAGTEYDPGYTALQQTAAHAFIDAGADAVIGTHPHVVEPLELYNGRPIFYSLGNFIFDQDFSWATEHSFAVRATFFATSTAYALIPITIQNEQVSVTSDPGDVARTFSTLVTPALPPAIGSAILDTHSFTLK